MTEEEQKKFNELTKGFGKELRIVFNVLVGCLIGLERKIDSMDQGVTETFLMTEYLLRETDKIHDAIQEATDTLEKRLDSWGKSTWACMKSLEQRLEQSGATDPLPRARFRRRYHSNGEQREGR